MTQFVLLLGLFTSCITARLVLLAGRAEVNLLSRNERSGVAIILTTMSVIAFIGILILGFLVFSWWVWLAAIIGFNVLATLGTRSDNFWSGLAAMPIFDAISIAAFIWAVVSVG